MDHHLNLNDFECPLLAFSIQRKKIKNLLGQNPSKSEHQIAMPNMPVKSGIIKDNRNRMWSLLSLLVFKALDEKFIDLPNR